MAKIFGDAKPWQLVLIALGVLGGIGGVSWILMNDDSPPLTRVLTLIDVSNGDIYEIDTSKRTPVLPEISPKTGKASLVPMRKSDDGNWFVDKRYVEGIEEGIERTALGEVREEKFPVKLSGSKGTLK